MAIALHWHPRFGHVFEHIFHALQRDVAGGQGGAPRNAGTRGVGNTAAGEVVSMQKNQNHPACTAMCRGVLPCSGPGLKQRTGV